MWAMTPAEKSQWIKEMAGSVGFDLAGVARAGPIRRQGEFWNWLATGFAGTMSYLRRNVGPRVDVSSLLGGAKSVIVVAHNYHQPIPEVPGDAPRGRVAMYAWGNDYHKVVKKKLRQLIDRMREEFEEDFEARPCVDTAPVIEREWAAMAGIGWIGKNTLVVNRELGSYFFLGLIVTTLELAYDQPVTDHCGSCTRCLDACPMDAFPVPYQMDASQCISYLTIEHREEIAESFHKRMGGWVFGCDVCQQVCPHNQSAPVTTEPRYAIRPPGPFPLLEELANWDEEQYRAVLRGSAIKRAKLDMLRRNARIALACCGQ